MKRRHETTRRVGRLPSNAPASQAVTTTCVAAIREGSIAIQPANVPILVLTDDRLDQVSTDLDLMGIFLSAIS